MGFGFSIGRRDRRAGRLAVGRWGVYGLAASLLLPIAYRYVQRRRSRPKTLPGYVSTPEYAAPVAH